MARNLYGIVNFGKLSVELIDLFMAGNMTDITSELTNEQKKILDELYSNFRGFSKLIYGDIYVVDSGGDSVFYKGLIGIGFQTLTLAIHNALSDSVVAIEIRKSGDVYEIYS